MLFLVIGNILSLIAAGFTAASSWARDRYHIYILQFWQCFILAVASIFFRSYAGIATLLLCAARNLMLAENHFTKKICYVYLIILLAVGLPVNNRGLIGLIPILATVIYTLGGYYCQREFTIKLNILLDLVLWCIYEGMIFDISSAVTDCINSAVTIAALIRILKEHHANNNN